MKIQFLNVDLEIENYQSLQPIVEDFGDAAINLYSGKAHGHYLATFEAPHTADVDSIISYFCNLVESLSGEAKILWETAFTRVFDIGFESGTETRSYLTEIRSETIKRLATLGASVRVTIYSPPPHQNSL
uniref:Uncharacterized protein n=1 Tax=Cyanothece sp. (strain PCC 7425 / ATCC 29141) TaxID=395961 RepID=B8HXJ5_CYAP4